MLTPRPGLRSSVLASAPAANAQLPPEIMVDRHLVRVDRLLSADDPGAALEVMNEILALQEEHDLELPNDFSFRYARVAFAAGRTDTAITSLNEYLLATGRRGEFYRDALELLDSADVRLEQNAAEQRRAEVTPRRVETQRQRAARWPPSHVFRDCETCPEMVILPGSAMALGRYEVTLGEYRAFASATGGGAGGGCVYFFVDEDYSWRNPNFPQTERHPVTCMNFDNAQAYVSWLSRTSDVTYRLPTWTELADASESSQPGCYRDRTGREGTCPAGTYGSNALEACRTCWATSGSGHPTVGMVIVVSATRTAEVGPPLGDGPHREVCGKSATLTRSGSFPPVLTCNRGAANGIS